MEFFIRNKNGLVRTMSEWMRKNIKNQIKKGLPGFYRILKLLKFIFAAKNYPLTGSGCNIHPTAMFVGDMSAVTLGDNVVVDAYAQIINSKNGRIEIGDGTYLAPFSVVKNAAKGSFISIGKKCSLQHYSIIYGAGPVTIGNYVRIAAHCMVVPVNKGFDQIGIFMHLQKGTTKGISIHDDVWIGAGSKILDGVTIKNGVVIGAGSTVTRDVGPNVVVVGSPARIITHRS